MKTLLLLLIFIPSLLFGFNTATLQWEPSPSAGVEGYIIYYGQDPDALNYRVVVTDGLTTTITGLAPGDWYFEATAYSAAAESDPSNRVSSNYVGFTAPQPVAHEEITVPVSPGTSLTINVNIGR